MPNRRPHSGDEFERTPACRRAAHVDCPHFHGFGGGFNPRRLRLEFGQQLCKCSCHASCPVRYEPRRLTVSKKAWYTSCTCPGAEVARQRLDDAGIEVRDFDEVMEEKRRRRIAGREAVEATRARAAGRSREEIREIYIAERRAKNLKVPEERVLDAVVEYITTGNRLPAIRVLFETGKGIYDDISRLGGRHAKGRTGGSGESG
jgi:hypothetical protein